MLLVVKVQLKCARHLVRSPSNFLNVTVRKHFFKERPTSAYRVDKLDMIIYLEDLILDLEYSRVMCIV